MLFNVQLLHEDAVMPSYAKDGDAGMDLTAVSMQEVAPGVIEYGIGIAMAIPIGYAGFIYPRSSISKYDQALCNSVGVIDSGYRGEFKCRFSTKFTNGREPILYKVGDRVAQLVLQRRLPVKLQRVDQLDETERGSGGFGHTGR